MNFHLEPVFQKRLQHGPPHHSQARWTFRFRVDPVAFGLDPAWRSFDPISNRRKEVELAIGIVNVRHLDE
jgi:hypothetical protein